MQTRKFIISTLIAALTIGGMAVSTMLLPADAAYAQGESAPALAITRTPLAPFRKDAAAAALSNYFKREQNFLTIQANHLLRANQFAAKAQQVLDAAKAEGKDVSSLEAALAQFNSTIGQAQSAHDAAAGIIAAHNGFDGSGAVTDLAAARQTTVDARRNLRSAHVYIVQAVSTLRQAVLQWRMSH